MDYSEYHGSSSPIMIFENKALIQEIRELRAEIRVCREKPKPNKLIINTTLVKHVRKHY